MSKSSRSFKSVWALTAVARRVAMVVVEIFMVVVMLARCARVDGLVIGVRVVVVVGCAMYVRTRLHAWLGFLSGFMGEKPLER
jgi:hypothetical protein